MIKIKLGSVQLVGMFLVLISSLIVAAFAAGQSNPYFSSPLIALLIMFYIGHLPLSGKRDWFLFAYVLLVLGSGAILMLTPEKIYWTSPMVLGVITNVLDLVPEIELTK